MTCVPIVYGAVAVAAVVGVFVLHLIKQFR